MSKLESTTAPRVVATRPVVLVIMDGVGVGTGDDFDAVKRADTPFLDTLHEDALYRTLRAHGTSVGLPSDADMGNSEVGHNILGAGRIFDQGAKCVDSALASGSIWSGTWASMHAYLGRSGGALHLVGLLSDGNVHSSFEHLTMLIEQAASDGAQAIYVHVLLDGRDVPDRSAHLYVERLESLLEAVRARTGTQLRIASGGGRMTTTMDRYEADWSVVERGWKAHVLGDARGFSSASDAIATFRAENPDVSDQWLPAFVIQDDTGGAVGKICDGDAVVLFNFRGDRAIEVSRAFSEGGEFDGFDRVRTPNVFFAGMVQYDGDLAIPENFLVTPETVDGTVSEVIAESGLTQFACAETQKFGHVTYFWNGNRSAKFSDTLETYLEVPSDTVPFEQRPWMKSAETADAIIEAVAGGRYRFIRANLAGGDMVGHTGNIAAASIAVEAVDLALARIAAAVAAAGGCLLVTADHGNADDMVERDADGKPLRDENGAARFRTSHSLNPVPFYLKEYALSEWQLRPGLNNAGLANVAATVLQLLGLEVPGDYEPSLLSSSSEAGL